MKYAVVRRDGWDEVLVSMHHSKEVAILKCDVFNGGQPMGRFCVLDLNDYEFIDLFGRKVARPKHGGV